MKPAPLPENEKERLKSLESYEILDTMPEQAYDDITSIAAEICDTPIALVSLVDEGRQWFKSRVGLSATETPRDIAFCSHAMLQPEVFEIPDALQDERFCDNPLVTSDPNIRFYAGAPLITSDGFALGTLCVIDRVPKYLSAEQKATLQAQSRQVVSQIELTKAVRDLVDLHKKTEAQANELKRSNEDLHQFAHVVAHDLKAPLRSIDGMLEILRDKYLSSLDEKAEDYVNRSINAARRMNRLIDDLLNFAALDGRVDQSAQCASKDALNYAIENIESDINSRHAEVKMGDMPSVKIKEPHLIQIFQNLISNSIKFTPNERIPLIQVAANSSDKEVEFTVTDNGLGVEPGQVDKVFTLFTRLHTDESIPGTGIGLATVRKIIENYNGKIWMTSEAGKGSVVHFVLPAA